MRRLPALLSLPGTHHAFCAAQQIVQADAASWLLGFVQGHAMIGSGQPAVAARLNSGVGPHKSKICSTARFIGKRLPACSSDGLFGACRDPHPFRFRPGAARTLWFLAIGAGGTGLSEFPASDCCAPTGSASAACADYLPCSPCLVRTPPSVRPNKSFKPTPLRGFLASFNGTL
jgi:hypothetical protein